MKELKTNPGGILIIGIGNDAREDDGLGWKFLEYLDGQGHDFLDCEFRYQLQVEDAATIANYEVVVFVDASEKSLHGGFEMRSCIAANHAFFSTHEQAPSAIVYLANALYKKFPRAYTLAISGNSWQLKSRLSREGKRNLK